MKNTTLWFESSSTYSIKILRRFHLNYEQRKFKWREEKNNYTKKKIYSTFAIQVTRTIIAERNKLPPSVSIFSVLEKKNILESQVQGGGRAPFLWTSLTAPSGQKEWMDPPLNEYTERHNSYLEKCKELT